MLVRGRECEKKIIMSPPFSFMLVTFFFWLVVGFGGLFPTTSALCGNNTGRCDDLVSVGDFGYPWAGNDYWDCGYPGLTFGCNYDGDLRSILSVSNDLYYILSKDEQNQRLRVAQVDVEEEECPRPMHNFTLTTTSPFSNPYDYEHNQHSITYFYNCSSGYPEDVVQGLPCLDTYYNNNTTPGLRSFAFLKFGNFANDRFNWYTRNCQEKVAVPAYDYSDIKKSLKRGFYLHWSTPEECKDCENSGGQCWFNHTTARVHHAIVNCSCPQHGTAQRKLFDKVCPPISQQGLSIELKIILGVCSGIGGLLLVVLFICRRKLFSLYSSTLSYWNSKIKSSANMEAFLESSGCPGLQRYTFSGVKKMTNTFNEKLGQGGFGSVFKVKRPKLSAKAASVL